MENFNNGLPGVNSEVTYKDWSKKYILYAGMW